MRRSIAGVCLVALGLLPAGAEAHEGHQHKVMGTVTAVHTEKAVQIEVKTLDGKTVVIAADEKTKYLKGDALGSLKDVTVDARIVATVTMSGSVTLASEIRVGAARDKHPHQ